MGYRTQNKVFVRSKFAQATMLGSVAQKHRTVLHWTRGCVAVGDTSAPTRRTSNAILTIALRKTVFCAARSLRTATISRPAPKSRMVGKIKNKGGNTNVA